MEYFVKSERAKPSISSLLELLNKPALVSWANKMGLKGVDVKKFTLEKKSKGTSFHSEIEGFLKRGEMASDAGFQSAIESFFAGCEILDCEKSIEHQYFVGRIDVRFRRNGSVWVCDFKTNKTKIYLENMLQLVAYKMATGCDRVGFVSVPEMKLIEVSEKMDLSPYEKMIYHLHEIFQLKKQTI